MPEPNAALNVLPSHTDHSRLFQGNTFVYPVLSRRSGGISVGINLNPDKVCNFDCVYCQVDRRSEALTPFVETEKLSAELHETLALVASGALYQDERFSGIPEPLRRLNDIAFSGDGEPTSFRNIPSIVADVAAIKCAHGLDAVKLVMITNASLFHRPSVRQALALLDANNGEVWAKLDAGTEDYYHLIERTTIPFNRILSNLREAGRVRPLVIQSLFMKVEGEGPSRAEVLAYCERLNEILQAGGRLSRVQVYTIARRPAESFVAPLEAAQVDAIAAEVRGCVPVTVEAYYGVG